MRSLKEQEQTHRQTQRNALRTSSKSDSFITVRHEYQHLIVRAQLVISLLSMWSL